MFVIRGKNGETIESTRWEETNNQEIRYETYGQAKEALKEFELSLPKGMFQITATECERCGGNDDIAIIHVNDNPIAYCVQCRADVFSKKRPVGRPTLGITKKVSLTLPKDVWDWLDEQAQGNRSKFIREAVWNALGDESEWSNDACQGYAIAAAKKLGYEDTEIKKLVQAMYGVFDSTNVSEAEDIYRKHFD